MVGEVVDEVVVSEVVVSEVVSDVDGDVVGLAVAGEVVGDSVGSEVTGFAEGDMMGSELVGDTVGDVVGSAVVGGTIGEIVTSEVVGKTDGDSVGLNVVGVVGDSVHPTWVNRHLARKLGLLSQLSNDLPSTQTSSGTASIWLQVGEPAGAPVGEVVMRWETWSAFLPSATQKASSWAPRTTAMPWATSLAARCTRCR